MANEVKKKAEEFLRSLDFKALGFKIELIENLMKYLVKKKKGKKIGFPRHGPEFLKDIEKEEIEPVLAMFDIEREQNIKKLKKLKEIFKDWEVDIDEVGGVESIAYPKGFKRVEIDVGVYNKKDVYGYTCDRMKKWYEENLDRKTKLFRTKAKYFPEKKLLKKRTFGFFRYNAGRKIPNVKEIQQLTFYKDRHEGKGIKPKIKNAHLLMLSDLLNFATEEKVKKLEIMLYPKKSDTTRKRSRDIAKIAHEYDEEYKEVIFKK